MTTRGIKLTNEPLQCPVCLIVPKSTPIFQCANGHIICKSCYPHLEKCPVCRIDLLSQQIRCLVAENIIPLLPRNCIFSEEGCEEPEKMDAEMIAHETLCQFLSTYLANLEHYMFRACMHNDEAIAKVLLQDGIENKKLTGNELSLFQWQCFKHNAKMAKFLLGFLASNANDLAKLAEEKDVDGRTMLHIACRYGQFDVVKKLVPLSDVNAKNGLGQTPLIVACIHEHVQIVGFLWTGYLKGIELGIKIVEVDDAFEYGLGDILDRMEEHVKQHRVQVHVQVHREEQERQVERYQMQQRQEQQRREREDQQRREREEQQRREREEQHQIQLRQEQHQRREPPPSRPRPRRRVRILMSIVRAFNL